MQEATTTVRKGRKPGQKVGPRRTVPRELRASWSVTDWCDAVGFSRAKFYGLVNATEPRLAKFTPRSVLLSGQRRIIESPRDYLDRIYATQQQTKA